MYKNHILFKFKDFRRLFLARLISAIGDKFFTISITWFILKSSEQGGRSLGIMMAINLLPLILFGPVMGSIADRLDRKKCIIAADLIRGLVMILFFIVISQGVTSVIPLYILCFISSSFTPLFESASNSSLVKLTDEENIEKAVALDSMTVQVSNVLGALLGGIFMALFGVAFAFLFNALTFFGSMLLVITIKTNLKVEKEEESEEDGFVEGFKYILSDKPVSILMFLFTVFNFFAAPIVIMIPMFVDKVLNETVEWVSYFEAFLSAGAVIMSVYLSLKVIEKSAKRIIFVGMILVGGSTALIGMLTYKWVVCVMLLINGIGLALVNASAMAIFQHRVAEEMKGRFFAILTMACFGVMPLAYIVVGFLSTKYGVDTIIAAEGICSVIISFGMILVPSSIENGGNQVATAA